MCNTSLISLGDDKAKKRRLWHCVLLVSSNQIGRTEWAYSVEPGSSTLLQTTYYDFGSNLSALKSLVRVFISYQAALSIAPKTIYPVSYTF